MASHTLMSFIVVLSLVTQFSSAFLPNGPASLGTKIIHVGSRRQEESLQQLLPLLAVSSFSVGEFFSDEFAEQLAADVATAVQLPFIPTPIVHYTLKQVFQKLSADALSKDSMERLLEILQTEATQSTLDDVSAEEIEALADQIANELNPKIDMPVLEEEQELLVLQQILRVVFAVLTSNNEERKKIVLVPTTTSSGPNNLLDSPASRRTLVDAINAAVNVPILDETQEALLIQAAVDASSNVLKSLLPPDMIATLKGETPEAIAKMKKYIITTVNEKVDFIGLNEEQEEKLLETMVDILIDQYVDGTEAKFLLLSVDEQMLVLDERKAALLRSKVLSQRRFEREQASLKLQLDRIEERIKTTRRKRSFFRRLFRRRR